MFLHFYVFFCYFFILYFMFIFSFIIILKYFCIFYVFIFMVSFLFFLYFNISIFQLINLFIYLYNSAETLWGMLVHWPAMTLKLTQYRRTCIRPSTWCKKNLLPLICGSILRLTCSLVSSSPPNYDNNWISYST